MHKHAYTDAALVLLVLAGDQSAYEILVQRHRNTVLSAAASVLHDRTLAEDAAQEAFLSAWLKLDLLRDGEKFGAWVRRIAVNCAKNTLSKYQQWICLHDPSDDAAEDIFSASPEEIFFEKEYRGEIHRNVQALSARGEQIIRMFYFDGLSISEIAQTLHIAPGTVKWHLNDARRRLHDALPEEKERHSAAWIRHIMSTLETLKYARMNNSHEDFASEYAEILENIRSLPESAEKQHAMAELFLYRYWWCPETEAEKNALMVKLMDAAVRGKNEDVMIFLAEKARAAFKAENRITFIEKYQLPMLEKYGFSRACAASLIDLGLEYFRMGNVLCGTDALSKAAKCVPSSDLYHAYAQVIPEFESLRTACAKKCVQTYSLAIQCVEVQLVHGVPQYVGWVGHAHGELRDDTLIADHIFRCASCCGGIFMRQNLSVGEKYTAEDGTEICFAAEAVLAETPAGLFRDCQLWKAKQNTVEIHTYYKKGIGIVKLERICDGRKVVRLLKEYTVRGGRGWLPLAAGNRWEYIPDVPPQIMAHTVLCETVYADDEKVLLNCRRCAERIRYDDTSWNDTMRQVLNEYAQRDKSGLHLCDVSGYLHRAEKIAETPLQKAHTAVASRVMERILRTDPVYAPHSTERGIWNFFQRIRAAVQDGTVTLTLEDIWHFEWKNSRDMTDAGRGLLYNNIYGILQYMTGCIWCEDWKNIGERIVRSEFAGCMTETLMHISAEGEITVKAGTFRECIKITLSARGFRRGMSYIGEKKTYYFALGIGIVLVIEESASAHKAVYELTAYSGTGEGYMPLSDGMMRKYEAQNLRDGYIGGAEYTYCADEDSTIVILGDLIGVKTEQNQNAEENP